MLLECCTCVPGGRCVASCHHTAQGHCRPQLRQIELMPQTATVPVPDHTGFQYPGLAPLTSYRHITDRWPVLWGQTGPVVVRNVPCRGSARQQLMLEGLRFGFGFGRHSADSGRQSFGTERDGERTAVFSAMTGSCDRRDVTLHPLDSHLTSRGR